MSTNVPNLKQIGGGHRKNGQKFVDLMWNDPSFFSLHQRIYSSVDTLLSFKWIWILPNEIRDERIRGTTKGGEICKKVQERRLEWYGRLMRRDEEYVGKE